MKGIGQRQAAFKKKNTNIFKQKIKAQQKKANPRISVDFSLDELPNLDSINEESFESPISSEKRLCSIRHTIDPKTLQKINTYRALMLPTLRNMSEEECFSRYLADPFFRKKLQYQLEFLRRSTMEKKPQKENKQNTDGKDFTEFENEGNRITFRECIQSQKQRKMNKKTKFQSLIKRVSSQGQFQSKF